MFMNMNIFIQHLILILETEIFMYFLNSKIRYTYLNQRIFFLLSKDSGKFYLVTPQSENITV